MLRETREGSVTEIMTLRRMMWVAMHLKSQASTGPAVNLREVLHHMLLLMVLLYNMADKKHMLRREEADCKDMWSSRRMRRVLLSQPWRKRQTLSCARCFPEEL